MAFAFFVYAIVINAQATIKFQNTSYDKLSEEENAYIKKYGLIFLSALSLFLISLTANIVINIFAGIANYKNKKMKLMFLSLAGALVSRVFSLTSAIISLKYLKNYGEI